MVNDAFSARPVAPVGTSGASMPSEEMTRKDPVAPMVDTPTLASPPVRRGALLGPATGPPAADRSDRERGPAEPPTRTTAPTAASPRTTTVDAVRTATTRRRR